jgi:hypothetical protein
VRRCTWAPSGISSLPLSDPDILPPGNLSSHPDGSAAPESWLWPSRFSAVLHDLGAHNKYTDELCRHSPSRQVCQHLAIIFSQFGEKTAVLKILFKTKYVKITAQLRLFPGNLNEI